MIQFFKKSFEVKNANGLEGCKLQNKVRLHTTPPISLPGGHPDNRFLQTHLENLTHLQVCL